MRSVFAAAAVLGSLLGSGTSLIAQSLADVAKREAARRQAIGAAVSVYTNDSLSGTAGTPPQVAPREPPGLPPSGSSPASSPTAGEPVAGSVTAAESEAAWRRKVAAVREALSRAEITVEALQSHVNALTTDVVSRDDPVQRAALASRREKALGELDRLRQEMEDHSATLAAIHDEARRAGVPAGWLRERRE